MTDFIRPQFSQTVVYEALLERSAVEKHAQDNGISFDAAVDELGRAYIQKHGEHCTTMVYGVSTPLEAV